MLKLIIVGSGLGLGLIAGSASALGQSRAEWRLDWVECRSAICTARLVSSDGDIDEIDARSPPEAEMRARLKLAVLN